MTAGADLSFNSILVRLKDDRFDDAVHSDDEQSFNSILVRLKVDDGDP